MTGCVVFTQGSSAGSRVCVADRTGDSGDEEEEGKRDGVEKDRRKKSSGSDIG